jgi:F0F1-type ATP synthase membrane subunit b/b'
MEAAPTFWEVLARWSEIVGGFAFIIAAVALFRKFLLPAVRANEISKNAELVAAEQRREELRAEVERARGRVEAAGVDAAALAERAESDARLERDRIVEEARREGNLAIENARGELERSRNRARDAMRIELIEKALLRARQLAAERFDEPANAKLVNKTVDDLVAGKNA